MSIPEWTPRQRPALVGGALPNVALAGRPAQLVVVFCPRGQNTMAIIVPVQCWLAREALGWSASHLARVTDVSSPTVRRFERGDAVRASKVEVIQRTLETAGVIFIDAEDGGPSARLRGRGEKYHVVVTQRGLSWEWERWHTAASPASGRLL
jgi:transcriptional regulator with XRE-family HTH domain